MNRLCRVLSLLVIQVKLEDLDGKGVGGLHQSKGRDWKVICTYKDRESGAE